MSGRSRLTEIGSDPTIKSLPPSAKLVAKALEYEGAMTQSQLAESTMLPPRTVRYALSELSEADIVNSQKSYMDARRRIYELRLPEHPE